MCKRLLVPVLATVAVLLAAPVLAEEIYRWVDDQGQIHFSDVPRDGAEQVELQPAQTFVGQRVNRTSSEPEQGDDEPAEAYSSLVITSPSQEETIWNTGGVITVAVNPTPALRTGHSLNIYYDGSLLAGKSPLATSTQLSGVYRGEHTITATIVDGSGQTLISAEPVTFFYQRTTVDRVRPPVSNLPAGAARPGAPGAVPSRSR